MEKKKLQKRMAVLAAGAYLAFPFSAYAQSRDADIDRLIAEQRQAVEALLGGDKDESAKGQDAENETLRRELEDVKKKLQTLQRDGKETYDAKGAVHALTQQIAELTARLAAQTEAQQALLSEMQALKEKEAARTAPKPETSGFDSAGHRAYGHTARFLVQPAPSEKVSYTQDAINAQGNSTMVFRYAPNQLYKIYCRMGYLTDIALKKGEKITFVGGGDTAGWAVNSTTVDGVPHLYIKPVVETSDTNLIVTTDHHSYQLLLQTSDWYNPMVVWSYDIEDAENARNEAAHDRETITSGFAVDSPDKLCFDYKIKGSGEFRPTMVFDDGRKMFIKFKKLTGKLPVLFGKERGRKQLSLLNYTIKDDCYIVDKILSEAELRMGGADSEVIRIRREG